MPTLPRIASFFTIADREALTPPTKTIELVADVRGGGSPVVLLHGQPGSAADWASVVTLLEQDHQVVVPDRPGYGRTGGVATGFTGNASATVNLLDRLQIDRAVIVGHSWAGGVALAAAVDHPSRVAGLVLAGSVHPGGRLGWIDRVLAARWVGEALSATTLGFTGWLLRTGGFQHLAERRFSARGRQAVRALSGVTGASTGAPVWRSFVIEQRRLLGELGEYADKLGSVQAPTVVLSGESDRIVPPAVGARLATAIPHAVHRTIPGAHHLLPLDHPDEIAAAVREVTA